ncbi:MAG: hypothetical protein ACREQQ_18970 [Candidatus Binatia bacterium]
MLAAHRSLGLFFGLLIDPLDGLGPLVGLLVISAVTGIALLFAFRWTSNPAAIRTARRHAQAHLLAVRIYREDLVVVLASQVRFLAALGRYMGRMLQPFLVLLVPFALLFAHLDARYGRRALQPGERALVKVFAERATLDQWRLESADGVEVETPPVRIPSRSEITWRIRAGSLGPSELLLVAGERRVVKQVRVASSTTGASPRRMAPSFASLFLAPSESPIEDGAGVDEIEVVYPPLAFQVFRWQTDWIVVFLVVSAAVAIALRRRAGVEFW